MTSLLHRLAAAVMAALFAAAAPAHAERELTDAPDPYVHPGTGLAFPEKPEGFRRAAITEHDGKAGDVSVDYWTDGTTPMLIGILLMKGDGGSCADWFAAMSSATMLETGVMRDADAETFVLLPDALFEQFSANYTLPARTLDADHPELAKPQLTACPIAKGKRGPAWVVQYSATLLASDGPRAEALARQLFATIDWSPLIGK
jgi:hypothetical protein